MSEESKTSQVNLRLQPALKKAAEKAAAQDHRSLTSLIEKLIADHVRTRPTLEAWHTRAIERFVKTVQNQQAGNRLKHGYSAHSYCIHTSTGEQLAAHELTDILRATHANLGGVFTSPHLFYPYTRKELLPYFTFDDQLPYGSADEILEFAGDASIMSWLEFWRLSPAGLASNIRPHLEDSPEFEERALKSGSWFCPYFLTRRLTEIVRHAVTLSRRFASAEAVAFRCQWTGLQDREIADPDPSIRWSPGKIARTGHRVSVVEWSTKDLEGQWAQVVCALGGPVMRLFDPAFDYSPEFIERQVPRFRQ
jgi:hypothetical protein